LKIVLSIGRSPCLINGHFLTSLDFDNISSHNDFADGYRAAPVRRQLTPGLISSLPETAGLPPFISFSTSYPELLNSVVRRLVHVPEASGASRAQILERFERGEFKSVHAAHCQRL
jgi:hypothetical protein